MLLAAFCMHLNVEQLSVIIGNSNLSINNAHKHYFAVLFIMFLTRQNCLFVLPYTTNYRSDRFSVVKKAAQTAKF